MYMVLDKGLLKDQQRIRLLCLRLIHSRQHSSLHLLSPYTHTHTTHTHTHTHTQRTHTCEGRQQLQAVIALSRRGRRGSKRLKTESADARERDRRSHLHFFDFPREAKTFSFFPLHLVPVYLVCLLLPVLRLTEVT